jgi:chemotaxis protein CheY-P-specific phosphatase CheC
MITNQLSLTRYQINSFDRFLIASIDEALNVLETVFALPIDSSDSSIKIVPAVNIEKIEPLSIELLSNGPLYVISSEMTGELQGGLHLLMRSSDFKNLGEVMKPILKLLFLSSSDTDLATLESQKPDWMKNNDKSHTDDPAFHEQMIDVLTEMGNILFGIYTSAIYTVYDLHTNHSVPEAFRDTDLTRIQQVLASPELLDVQHLVIQNEFRVLEKPIKLWCLVSPTQKSFQEILNRIE